jgi:uncharacterized membrane protein YdjX (TVP38/TMEM64 family)
MNENISNEKKPQDWWKPIVFIVIIVTLFIVMNVYGFGGKIEELQLWIQSLGLWGPIAFFVVYIGAVIATIPGTIFGIIAGALFGSE